MKKILNITSALTIASWATSGMAFFDGEAFYGSKSAKTKYSVAGVEKSKDLRGTEIGASFLLDPIPLVPVAFGVVASQSSTDLKHVIQEVADGNVASDSSMAGFSGKGTGTSKTLFYGPVIKAWVPMPKIKPYVKAAYLMGTEVIDETMDFDSPSDTSISASFKQKTTYSHTATEMTVGLGFSPVKLTSIFAEYTMHSGKRKAKSLSGETTITSGGETIITPITSDSLSADDKKEESANATSIRVGFSVGI